MISLGDIRPEPPNRVARPATKRMAVVVMDSRISLRLTLTVFGHKVDKKLRWGSMYCLVFTEGEIGAQYTVQQWGRQSKNIVVVPGGQSSRERRMKELRDANRMRVVELQKTPSNE